MRSYLPAITAVTVLSLLTGPADAVHLRGKIVRVGFVGRGSQQDGTGSDHYRPGSWVPILVELTNDDGDLFEGAIEARQPDRDGDALVASMPVAVRGARTYYLYVPASVPSARGAFTVRASGSGGGVVSLYDDQNKPVRELKAAGDPRPISGDSRVILDISQPPLNNLDGLAFDALTVHPVVVLRVAGSELPDKSPGLQMADAIVWDDADPGKLRDVTQIQALLEWTRQGGTLVLGVARNWQELSRSPLGEHLPGKLSGTKSANELEQLSQALLGLNVPFDSPLVHCPIRRSDLAADASPVVPPDAGSNSQVFVARRPCGRGQIVLVAAEIHDLMARGTQNEVFLRDLLGVRRYTQPQQAVGGAVDLFSRYVEGRTAFQMTTGLYFLVAFLFVVAYILVATGGSWTWLKRRARLHYTWLAFAGIAVLASGTSLAAVQMIRGIGHRVQQLTILDGRAGSSEAAAVCYFGLKTPTHSLLDLAVPADPRQANDSLRPAGSLMPLPTDPDDLEPKTYSAGQSYQAVAALGQLQQVPLRATLKQFQGYWEGQLGGQFLASLRYRGESFRVTADSWIENRLGHDLHDCHLLVAGVNLLGERVEGSRPTYRGQRIEVYPLGDLPNGKRLNLGEWMVQQLRKGRTDAQNAEAVAPEDYRPKSLQTMADEGWFSKVGLRVSYSPYQEEARQQITAGEWVAGMLLLSVCDEFDQRELMKQSQEIGRSRGRELDRSAYLTRDMALLIGFSDDDPGPARLCWRPPSQGVGGWRTIEPSDARTVYRMGIPVSP